jgi:hypothetical protein
VSTGCRTPDNGRANAVVVIEKVRRRARRKADRHRGVIWTKTQQHRRHTSAVNDNCHSVNCLKFIEAVDDAVRHVPLRSSRKQAEFAKSDKTVTKRSVSGQCVRYEHDEQDVFRFCADFGSRRIPAAGNEAKDREKREAANAARRSV